MTFLLASTVVCKSIRPRSDNPKIENRHIDRLRQICKRAAVLSCINAFLVAFDRIDFGRRMMSNDCEAGRSAIYSLFSSLLVRAAAAPQPKCVQPFQPHEDEASSA